LAKFAARQSEHSAHNPPVRVVLTRHFRYIPPPGKLMPPFSEYSFYSMDIKPEDLR
jgi:hypothetical protein